MAQELPNYRERQKNFVKQYADDEVLGNLIPEVTKTLMYDQFRCNIISPKETVPIVWHNMWVSVLEFVKAQKSEEFAIDVCGISLEYITEYSHSDKPTNIVPQMFHKKECVFVRNEHQHVYGADWKAKMTSDYNAWRTVNLTETLDKLETDTFAKLISEYGIDLEISACIMPMIAATYAAGLQVARKTKQTVNMYNIFEIDVIEGDKILLTPLAMIKQSLKDDSNWNHGHNK